MAEMDPRLVRMMARHYRDLQGLRLLAIALGLQIPAHAWLTTNSEFWTMAAGLCGFTLCLVPIALLDRYYARFGRVVSKPLPRWFQWLGPGAVPFLMSLPSYGLPNVVWVVGAAGPLWIAWDCRPFRWHYLLVSTAMLYVAFGRLAFPDTIMFAWMAPRWWAFTSALALCGLLDHKLFAGAMRATRAVAGEAV